MKVPEHQLQQHFPLAPRSRLTVVPSFVEAAGAATADQTVSVEQQSSTSASTSRMTTGLHSAEESSAQSIATTNLPLSRSGAPQTAAAFLHQPDRPATQKSTSGKRSATSPVMIEMNMVTGCTHTHSMLPQNISGEQLTAANTQLAQLSESGSVPLVSPTDGVPKASDSHSGISNAEKSSVMSLKRSFPMLPLGRWWSLRTQHTSAGTMFPSRRMTALGVSTVSSHSRSLHFAIRRLFMSTEASPRSGLSVQYSLIVLLLPIIFLFLRSCANKLHNFSKTTAYLASSSCSKTMPVHTPPISCKTGLPNKKSMTSGTRRHGCHVLLICRLSKMSGVSSRNMWHRTVTNVTMLQRPNPESGGSSATSLQRSVSAFMRRFPKDWSCSVPLVSTRSRREKVGTS